MTKNEHHHRPSPQLTPQLPLLAHRKTYSPRLHALIHETHALFGTRRRADQPPGDLSNLLRLLRSIVFSDVNERLDSLAPGEVGYVSVADEPNFTIGIFLLAPGATIPLHDHPEMCVASQLVFGSVEINSYDYCDPANHLARVVDDHITCHAPHTRTLYAHSGGNLHTFYTHTGCIFLDVMSPPYADDRECTYYRALPTDNPGMVQMQAFYTDFEMLDMS